MRGGNHHISCGAGIALRCRHGLRAGRTATSAEDLDGNGQRRARTDERQLRYGQHQRSLRHHLRSAAAEHRQVGRALSSRQDRGRSHRKPPGLQFRDQYRLTPRSYVFGQNQYLKDQFKEIDYLVAPTGGLGYKLFDTAATKLDVDGSVGMVWEKNPGFRR